MGLLSFAALAGFKKALRPFSVERPKSRSGTYSGRFGSDFEAPPGRISDFWPVTPTFALYLCFSGGNPNHFAESQPRIISTGFYSKGSLNPINVCPKSICANRPDSCCESPGHLCSPLDFSACSSVDLFNL